MIGQEAGKPAANAAGTRAEGDKRQAQGPRGDKRQAQGLRGERLGRKRESQPLTRQAQRLRGDKRQAQGLRGGIYP